MDKIKSYCHKSGVIVLSPPQPHSPRRFGLNRFHSTFEMDEGTKNTVSKLPLLTVRASPRDNEAWTARLKEELTALIQVLFMSSGSAHSAIFLCDTVRNVTNADGTGNLKQLFYIHFE